jgi:hypothetical protein
LSRVWFRQVLEHTGEATVYQLETIILNCPQTSFTRIFLLISEMS